MRQKRGRPQRDFRGRSLNFSYLKEIPKVKEKGQPVQSLLTFGSASFLMRESVTVFSPIIRAEFPEIVVVQ